MKVINNIGDWLYKITDRYFQGENCAVTDELDHFSGQISETKTVSWELNQGVEDIIINDLVVSIKCIIPAFITRKASSLINRIRFLFLVDSLIEEETLDPESVKARIHSTPGTIPGKIIVLDHEALSACKKRIISLSEWLKLKLVDLGSVIRSYKRVKPYYLLGDFSPVNYSVSSNKTKFLDTYVYHMRN